MNLKIFLCSLFIVSIAILTGINSGREAIHDVIIDTQSTIDLAWSTDGEYLALSQVDGIVILETDNQSVIQSISTSSYSIAWKPDNSQIATYSLSENVLFVFDVETGELAYTIQGDSRVIDSQGFIFINELIWNDCGLFSINGSIDLFVWGDSPLLKNPIKLTGHEDVVIDVAITDDCQHIITSATDRTIKIWDISSGESILSITAKRAFSLRDDSLIYISSDNALVEYSISQQTSHVYYEFDEDTQILDIDWSYDRNFIAYLTNFGTPHILQLDNGEIYNLTYTTLMYEILWNPHRPLLASLDTPKVVRIHSLEFVAETD